MKARWPHGRLLVSLVLLVVVATGCRSATASPATPSSVNAGSGLARVGAPAPAVSLRVPDGGTRDLAAERGKVVLLNFWATWCVPCRAEMPELQRLADDLHAEPFTLLTVDLEEDSSAVQGFRHDLGLRMPVLLDADGDVSTSYGVRGLPATFLIDAGGELRQQRLGPLVTGEDDTAWSRAWLSTQVHTLLQGTSRGGAHR